MSRDIFHQTRLLRAPSNLTLNTAREGASTEQQSQNKKLCLFSPKLRFNLSMKLFFVKGLASTGDASRARNHSAVI